MPTRKEASKIKQDQVAKKQQAIKSRIQLLQENIYEKISGQFLKTIQDPSYQNTLTLESIVKKELKTGYPDVIKSTITSARSIVDLNQMYFSTLMESNRIDEIRDKTSKIVDRRLGIDENGKIKQGGFADRALDDATMRKQFIKEVKKLSASGKDIGSVHEVLKKFITGNNLESGFIDKHYNTFGKDLLYGIDRSNGNVYSNELGLNYGYYGGGLIITSRCFCIKCNGKIFSREQMEKWRDKLNESCGPIWNEKKDGRYDPIENMGGYGCLHQIDWVTDSIAIGNIREQNKKAAERNAAFKDRNNL